LGGERRDFTGKLYQGFRTATVYLLGSLQQFAEFLHLATAAVPEEASTGLVPLVIMNPANPVRVGIAIHADVNRALFGASVIAAGVSCHGRRRSIHVGGTEMVPLSQGYVLPDKEKVVLLSPPLRAVTNRTVFCAYQPVTHPLDEQGVPDVQFCVHSLANPPRRRLRPVLSENRGTWC